MHGGMTVGGGEDEEVMVGGGEGGGMTVGEGKVEG